MTRMLKSKFTEMTSKSKKLSRCCGILVFCIGALAERLRLGPIRLQDWTLASSSCPRKSTILYSNITYVGTTRGRDPLLYAQNILATFILQRV